VGRKFGKKTQELIVAGKEGNYTSLKDGAYEIAGERLESDEVEIGFLTQEGMEAESSRDTIVILDTHITDELATQGCARDLIRAIQELRKKSGFEITDRISIHYKTTSEKIKKAFTHCHDLITKETLANHIKSGKGSEDVVVDGENVKLELEKDL
ncbi:MAG TPA: DUF5915 domain-containing protein, partial [Candidatus Gracilibacteria bacterium]